MATQKVHIGKLLVENNIISQEQLDQAIEKQKISGERLGKVLVDLGLINENKLLSLLAQQLGIPYIDLKNYSLRADLVHRLPELYARRYRAIVLSQDARGYLVGMADPQDILACDEISRILNGPVHYALIREEDLLEVIDMEYRRTTEISTFAEELSAELKKNDFDITQLGIGLTVADAPVVKMIQSIFEDAVQVNASDIHIEPDENVLRIRQRIDGVLHEHIVKEKQIAQAVTQRLKLMAGLNIAEKRIPQDGRFSIKIKDKNFDIRLSSLPIQFGESIVMRLLNHSAQMLHLDQIGMPESILRQLRKTISLPNGLLLITGPTGSGKTTTLYGALSELNTTEKKIITVEDPVEYRLPRINQVQVQPKIDLTFARVLRSVLRQDPDIVMIGELRDQETVQIALRAAMTGHFVLSTLHTNDAISSALRLIDMGAESYLIAAVLRAIIAQRLVRRICKNCIQDHALNDHEKIWLTAVAGPEAAKKTYKAGLGCAYCHRTGYKGQIGVFEFLEMTPELTNALRDNATKRFTRLANEQPHFKSLARSGLDIASEGITTISEVMRISGESLVNLNDNDQISQTDSE